MASSLPQEPPRQQAPPPQTWRSKLAQTARVQAWWSNKFSPVLATAYATACLVGAPVAPLVPRLLLLLVALVVGATYVSVVNDWTDLADDLAAGKPNHLASRPAAYPRRIVAGCLAVGLALGAYFWAWSPPLALCYLGSWVAFSAYSLAPFRLKKRGLAGVLADASGSHLFPQLLAVSGVVAWTGHAVPGLWYAAVGVWAFACGLRNILYHQLEDVEADDEADVNTWVRVRGVRFTQRVGQLVAFPFEVLGFATLLVLSRQAGPVVLLAGYLALEVFKWRLWGQRAQVLEPHQRILLSEYYEVYYPLGFLLVLLSRQPADGLALGVHVLLFGQCFWQTLRFAGVAAGLLVRKVLGAVGLGA